MEETEVIEVPMSAEEKAERAEWEAGAKQRELDAIDQQRFIAYAKEADPIYMEWQATGDDTMQADWLAKREEIKERYPKPDGTK